VRPERDRNSDRQGGRSGAIHAACTRGRSGRPSGATPSDVFLTLASPIPTPELEALGHRLDTERRELMLARG